LTQHYRRTLDDPLPLLDDKTPRQAVKTKKGRAQIVGWLKLLENSEFRRAAGQGHNPYDTAWMWRELKLGDSRKPHRDPKTTETQGAGRVAVRRSTRVTARAHGS
jgi:hypothetical protein